MSIWVVLNFLNQFLNAGTLRLFSQRKVVVQEFGSPCLPRSPSSVHDSRHEQQWIFHSFTKYFIINVDRIAVMNRKYSRVVFCFSCMRSSNRSLRSVMSLLNIETLTVFRNNWSSRSVWRTEFFVKRINIDLLRMGRVSSILHVIKSPDLSRIGFGVGWVCSKIVLVEKLLLLVVEQLSNPILLSNRDVVRSLVEVEVTCMLSHTRLLQFSV